MTRRQAGRLCYPSGKYTSAVANEVAAAGYHDATTTAYGLLAHAGRPVDMDAAARWRLSGFGRLRPGGRERFLTD